MDRDSIYDDPEFRAYVRHVGDNVIPDLDKADIFVSITPANPEEVDIKFATELGLAIMLDKPIIAAIRPGTKVPEKLAKVVEHFVEMDENNLGELSERIKNVVDELDDIQ